MMDGTSYMFIYFKFTDQIHNLLFKGWNSDSKTDMLGVCFAMAALIFTIELLSTINDYIRLKMAAGPVGLIASVSAQTETSPLLRALQIPPSEEHMQSYRLKLHLVRSLIVPIQLALGYMLMLAVMSYNAWILVTVAIAGGCMCWLFSVCRLLLREKFDCHLRSQSNQNELRQQETTSSEESTVHEETTTNDETTSHERIVTVEQHS